MKPICLPWPSTRPVASEAARGEADLVFLARELLREPYVAGFGAATVAVQVGKEIWIGTNRGDRIGYFPVP